MPENIRQEDISEELKKVPASQYDIAQVRASLYDIQLHLQKIYNAIEINKTAQSGICSVHGTRTTLLETKAVEIEKRVTDLEDDKVKPKNVDDIESRVSKIEKVMYIGLGVIGLIQVALPFIMKYWK